MQSDKTCSQFAARASGESAKYWPSATICYMVVPNNSKQFCTTASSSQRPSATQRFHWRWPLPFDQRAGGWANKVQRPTMTMNYYRSTIESQTSESPLDSQPALWLVDVSGDSLVSVMCVAIKLIAVPTIEAGCCVYLSLPLHVEYFLICIPFLIWIPPCYKLASN